MEKRTAQALAKGELSKDFQIRDHGASIKDAIILILAAALIASTTMIVSDSIILTCAVVTVLGMICCYIALDVNKQKALLKITEFQSALFASALGMNHDFTFIVELKKHSIFYINPLFQTAFPEFHKQDDRSLAKFFELNQISEENQKTIHVLLDSHKEENLVIDISTGEETKKLTISLEPIPRPSGFVLIRGRFL